MAVNQVWNGALGKYVDEGGSGTVLVAGSGTTDGTNGYVLWSTGALTTATTKTVVIPATNTPHPDGMYRITVRNGLSSVLTLKDTVITETVTIGGSEVNAAFASFANAAIATGATVSEVVQGLALPAKVVLTLSTTATNGDHAWVRVEQV